MGFRSLGRRVSEFRAWGLGGLGLGLRRVSFRIRQGACLLHRQSLPIGSVVVSFWGLPYRILFIDHKEELIES